MSLVTSEERFFSMSYMSVSSGGLPRLGLSSGSQPAPAIQAITAPRISVLIERRVSQPLFLTFQASASYGEGKNEVSPELTAHQLELDGELGFRHVLNPRGLVEISWFATAGVRYANVESRSLVGVYNQSPPYDVTMTLRVSRGHSFAVGVVAGLAVERELIEGLALRLSAGILGASYGLSSFNDWTSAEAADYRVHEFDLGLRFIPSLALRYAF
ncbi:MAG: hypothetical protein HY901_06500 [Deltaproteobacteria bacterium]|nr:hypothetical protein [Deltaproteobacteria bacterium]